MRFSYPFSPGGQHNLHSIPASNYSQTTTLQGSWADSKASNKFPMADIDLTHSLPGPSPVS